jgi:hypothetical protein
LGNVLDCFKNPVFEHFDSLQAIQEPPKVTAAWSKTEAQIVESGIELINQTNRPVSTAEVRNHIKTTKPDLAEELSTRAVDVVRQVLLKSPKLVEVLNTEEQRKISYFGLLGVAY